MSKINATLLELEISAVYLLLLKDYSSHLINSIMDGFKARDVSIRAQKKILSKMAYKNLAKLLIDDTSANIMDNTYKLLKNYTGNKKEAEKVVKNIIKIFIKLTVLYRHDQLTDEDLVSVERFTKKFNSVVLAIVSFHEVEYMYDRMYLIQLLAECMSSFRQIVQRHLTEKSMQRVVHVFSTLSDPAFLDAIFRPKSEHREIMAEIVRDINKVMDMKELSSSSSNSINENAQISL